MLGHRLSKRFIVNIVVQLNDRNIGAQVLFKATKVEGIYDRDPARHEGAQFLTKISYDKFLADKIGVMDQTAVTLCRENKLPIRVFKLAARGNILRVCMGETIGTIVEG